ncbi:Enhancer of translation termination 1 [Spathaspora sp. JA1]|nr:Enhancer of translation termination 1 [Spathaspora sp. JA1]
MAKRTLGLGKAAKAKKQKIAETVESEIPEKSESPQLENELTIQLNEEVDPNDDFAQLKALYKTFTTSAKDSELVINGVIHECDRILRNAEPKDVIPDYFYIIYGLSLNELAKFHTENKEKLDEYFKAALERIEDGLAKYENNIGLLLAKSRILLNELTLVRVSPLTLESKAKEDEEKLSKLLDDALQVYEQAEDKAEESAEYELFDEDNLDLLTALDDLLDIVDNFGKDTLEGLDEDQEEDDIEDEVDLPFDHPLVSIRDDDRYNQWWRDHTHTFLENVDKHLKKNSDKKDELAHLRREICRRLGQSYLQEAELPSLVFTSLSYDDDYKDEEELHGLTSEEAQGAAQELIAQALKYLTQAEDKEEPETWVDIAEAMISLGNLYDVDSEEQESLYADAEAILNKANNVTNGKYKDVLDNLLQ